MATGNSVRSADCRVGSRRINRINVQAKLLAMLLATSVLSAAIVGFIGYQSGQSSLRSSAFDRLTGLRESQSRELASQISDLKNSLVVYSRGSTATNAVESFTAGFDQLNTATITSAQQASIANYYTNQFAKDEQEQTGTSVDVRALLPTSPAQSYLQAHYTAPFSDFDLSIKNDDAGDGSAWSAANARYNEFFREIVTRFDFEDALLLDTRGNVVYTAYKGVDLGTNVLTGPYRGSKLTDAYKTALAANAVDYVGITDFGDYEPADEPTAWLVSPVGPTGREDGVLALQFPAGKINRLMTADQGWENAGMGRTGETFIVGSDDLMRSDSRLFLEDPQAFKREVIAAGTPGDVAEESIRQHGTILVQPVSTDGSRAALRGQTGTVTGRDYLGHDTLQAYAPVDLPGLNWSVVAKIDTAEAFAPVAAFTRTLVLSTFGIILVVSVGAILIAKLFVRPIRRLETGARRIGAGEYGVTVAVQSRDEFGDLTVAFNTMSRNLNIKDDLLVEQRNENQRLLLTLMPEAVVGRYLEGEQTIAREHRNATVIFAKIDGLDDASAKTPSDESVAIVNTLFREFDAAAENLGVERVRTLHNGYLASCGVAVDREDNACPVVDFAMEMHRILEGLSSRTTRTLTLRAGIDAGSVTSGLVGRSTVVYDIWGPPVDLTIRIGADARLPGIYVTAAIYAAARHTHHFVPAGDNAVDGTATPIWRLDPAMPPVGPGPSA